MVERYFNLIDKIKERFIINRKNTAYGLMLLCFVMCLAAFVSQNYKGEDVEYSLRIAFALALMQFIEIKCPENYRKRYGYFLLMISPMLVFYGMEFLNQNKISEMAFKNVLLNYVIYLFVYIFLYVISNRISVSIIMGNIAFYVYIICNDFVHRYRGTPIRAWDILAMRTAINVAGEYELKLSYEQITLLIWLSIVSLMALKIRWHERNWKKRCVNSLMLAATLMVTINIVLSKEFIIKNKLRPDWWQIEESAIKQGMFWDLVAGIPFLEVEKPSGYSVQKVREIQKKALHDYEANNKEYNQVENVDVIAIMNESFSDLRVLGDLKVSEEYMPYFSSLNENTVRGNLYVPIRGGLTSNSEFEFITGFSCAFLPKGTIAYQTVIKDGTYNLSQIFKEKNYHTTFMHPFDGTGWNRNSVYKNFGFDEALFLEDMQYDEKIDFIRGFVSDQANFEKIIEVNEAQKEKGENLFLFDVTMQNHGGYSWRMNDIKVEAPIKNDAETEEYLSLIKKTDEAFERLIEYYSQVKKPTVILMFGDHQPGLQNMTNALQGKKEGKMINEWMEEYCVPFVIWANYDIEEKYYEALSVNYLQTLLMEVAGMPLNDYQIFLKSVMDEFPVITTMGMRDKEGNWIKFEEGLKEKKIKDYWMVQYRKLIEKGE